jgi:protein TonB
MERPKPMAQPAPQWSQEAKAARVEGTALLKCVITVEGTLTNCRIIKGLPYMDKAILEMLKQWRYTPVMFQGHPVSVDYPITLHLVAP